jgi:glycosyltransferase involved in cell wall biosynthesis
VGTERHGLGENVRELSVFFPAHDEAENLERTVHAALAALDGLTLRHLEMIVVDDGSTDGTGDIADTLSECDPRIRVVHHPANRGYGAALKSGFAAARLEWVFYTDSDGQFDVGDIDLLLPYADQFDAIVGYRIHRSDRTIRKLNQALWSRLVRVALGVDSRDVDCAFKLVRRTSLDRIGPLVSDGAVISAELLVKLRRSGATIKQVGVTHHPRMAGKPSGGNPRVIARAFRELFRLRRMLRTWSPTAEPRLRTPSSDTA